MPMQDWQKESLRSVRRECACLDLFAKHALLFAVEDARKKEETDLDKMDSWLRAGLQRTRGQITPAPSDYIGQKGKLDSIKTKVEIYRELENIIKAMPDCDTQVKFMESPVSDPQTFQQCIGDKLRGTKPGSRRATRQKFLEAARECAGK